MAVVTGASASPSAIPESGTASASTATSAAANAARFLDDDVASVERVAVETFDGRFGVLFRFHVDESKVLNDVGFCDRAEHFKQLAQRFAFRALGEVADEQLYHFRRRRSRTQQEGNQSSGWLYRGRNAGDRENDLHYNERETFYDDKLKWITIALITFANERTLAQSTTFMRT